MELTNKLTKQCLTRGIVVIKKAFPSLPKSFYEIFIERLKANGFTDEKLNKAINHVIDNCKYPTPTIANFISFDGNDPELVAPELPEEKKEYLRSIGFKGDID